MCYIPASISPSSSSKFSNGRSQPRQLDQEGGKQHSCTCVYLDEMKERASCRQLCGTRMCAGSQAPSGVISKTYACHHTTVVGKTRGERTGCQPNERLTLGVFFVMSVYAYEGEREKKIRSFLERFYRGGCCRCIWRSRRRYKEQMPRYHLCPLTPSESASGWSLPARAVHRHVLPGVFYIYLYLHDFSLCISAGEYHLWGVCSV